MDLQLRDTVVLVTGGTSGIGLATCELLLAEGASVATCGRDLARLDAARERFAGVGDRFLAAVCDVRSPEAVEALVAGIDHRFGRLDGLVNNAGESRMKGWADAEWSDWQDELELKFAGVVHTTKAALPLLEAAPSASIVNINAVLARQPEARLVTTSAARAGLLNLSKSLSQELGPLGIRVNSVCLGLIDSAQWRRRYEAAGTDHTWEEWTADLAADRGVVLGRIGDPSEVATTIAYLLSPLAGYITGSSIDVAGGVARYV